MHLAKIQELSQLDPGKRKPEAVATHMTKTFADRRATIVTECATVKEVQQLYPLLCCATEMVNEFERIAGFNLGEVFEKGVDKYAHKLVMLKPLKNEEGYVKKLRLHIASAKTENERLCK